MGISTGVYDSYGTKGLRYGSKIGERRDNINPQLTTIRDRNGTLISEC